MIVYIHGASATSESFSYIREHISKEFKEPDILLDYKSSNGFDNNLNIMISKLANAKKLFFISHSLGGIYALHLANIFQKETIGGISLSTPYGGSQQADFAKYFLPFNQLMRDIGTMSMPMLDAKILPAPKNWTNIVTTAGRSPWICGQNDGVVTTNSMKYRTDFELIEVNLNHYEVVLSTKVLNIISDKIRETI